MSLDLTKTLTVKELNSNVLLSGSMFVDEKGTSINIVPYGSSVKDLAGNLYSDYIGRRKVYNLTILSVITPEQDFGTLGLLVGTSKIITNYPEDGKSKTMDIVSVMGYKSMSGYGQFRLILEEKL